MSPGNLKRHEAALTSLLDAVETRLRAFVESAQKEVPPDVDVCVICGTRTMSQQAALYAIGRTKPGNKVTNARPGSSWHNKGRAIDLGLFRAGVYLDEARPKEADLLYSKIGAVAKKMGVEWAGTWKSFQETPHFQITDGKSLGDCPNI